MSESIGPIQVSVCIASYNYAQYIGEAIESVFSQTLNNWELIIVDDASSDDSVSIILELQKRYPHKVKLIESSENHGVCYTINQACYEAKGELIALLGADDRMLPERLEKQVTYMNSHSNVAAICSLVEVIDENGIVQKEPSVFDTPVNDLATQLLSGNFLNAPSALFRRDLIDSVGLYNEKLPYVQDLDHWLRISNEMRMVRMGEVLTQYRIHGDNLSFKPGTQQAFASVYETIFVILRAIKAKAGRVRQSESNNVAKVQELTKYAQAAKGIEQNLLGQFRWSIDLVYSLVLDVCEYEPNNLIANQLLKEVYCAIGDTPRSKGNKPITISSYQFIQSQFPQAGLEPLEVVIQVHKQTGLSQLKIAEAMIVNKEELFPLLIEKEFFLLDVCQVIYDGVSSEKMSLLGGGQRNEVAAACELLNSGRFELLTCVATDLYQKFVEWRAASEYGQWIKKSTLHNDSVAYGLDKQVAGVDNKKIAVVLHLYYFELWEQFELALSGITKTFDLYISIRKKNNCSLVEKILKSFPDANIYEIPNKGRDILPFLCIFKEIEPLGYELILKLHTKKSPHLKGYKGIADYGEKWREATLTSLFGGNKRVNDIFDLFDSNPNLGVFSPVEHLYPFKSTDINYQVVNQLLPSIDNETFDSNNYSYAGGSMFWFRPEALKKILQLDLTEENFEEELGQLDGTLAHAIERLFGVVCQTSGYILTDRMPKRDDVVYQNWLDSKRESEQKQSNNFLVTHDECILKIHCIIYVDNEDLSLLANTIDSFSAQSYGDWHLSVVSCFACPDEMFNEVGQLSWLQVSELSELNVVLDTLNVESDWLAIIEAGDCLEAHALTSCVEFISNDIDAQVVYTDDDKVSSEGFYHSPQFKPDFNLDLLYSTDYTAGLVLFNAASLNKIDGIEFPSIFLTYDLILNYLDTFSEKEIAHKKSILLHRSENVDAIRSLQTELRKKVLSNHFTRNNIQADILGGYIGGDFKIEYQHIDQPKVSIIIPTKDQLPLLKACVESILDKTEYLDYEIIIIDNQSKEVETLDYFKVLQEKYSSQVRVIEYAKPYNYSEINNFAVQQAVGDYLVLLNNDTMILQGDWLAGMLNHAMREEVGVVGVKLVFPDKTLQHAGVVLGMGANGVAEHPHIGISMELPGYMNRAAVTQSLSAVTAACLMVEKDLYQQIGGLDEDKFKILYNDVDLCLKVRETGKKVIWTPHVTLIHHGSSSLKKVKQDKKKTEQSQQEANNMLEKWLPQLANDPAYNCNLSLKTTDFQPETSINVSWNADFIGKPRVYAFPMDSFGVGQYRVRAPVNALTTANIIESGLANDFNDLIYPTPVEIERIKPDVLLGQNLFLENMLTPWKRYKKFNSTFMVAGLDDLVYTLPIHHPRKEGWAGNIRKNVKDFFRYSDRVVVANDALAEEFKKLTSNDIIVVPNYLENWRWQFLDLPEKKVTKKMRVGWAGGREHITDLQFILPIVEALHKEVDWVFMGSCLEEFKPYIKEIHGGVEFDCYPQKLADLNLDLAIAPLMHNKFNECKTNLRLLEFGMMYWPVVCSDILPYQNAPVTRIANNANEWIRVIRDKINEPAELLREGVELRQWVIDNYMLDDHIDEWATALLPN